VGVDVPQSLSNALGEQLPPLFLTVGEPHLVIALLAFGEVQATAMGKPAT